MNISLVQQSGGTGLGDGLVSGQVTKLFESGDIYNF